MDKNKDLVKNYFIQAAKDNDESVREYLKCVEHNYVIVEDGRVVVWVSNDSSNNCPVIFGDEGDALNELGNWCCPIRNVSIITEKEMLETYCKEEYEKALAETKKDEIMFSVSHDEELVSNINDAWAKNKEAFRIILCALYNRDIDEITDADCFQIPEWKETSQYNVGIKTDDWSCYNAMALADMNQRWDEFANNYLDHIADDTDLQCILNFLHYPYLPVYKDNN